MGKIYRQAIIQSVLGILFFIALIFGAAGTWSYWQGWMFLAVFLASTIAFTIYLVLYDKELLKRRMNAGPWKEKETSQKIIVSLIIISFFTFMVLSILDYRFGLSQVAPWASILGDAIIALSFLAIFWVVKVNSWAASNINVEKGQKVIETGPYAYIRHPMYAGTVWLFIGIPLAFGSWWSIGLLILFLPILIWRLLDEERMLRQDLPGYTDYMHKVKFRLIPYIW